VPVERLAALVAHEHGSVEHGDRAAFLRHHAILGVERIPELAGICDLGEHAVAVVRVEDLREEVRVLEPLRDRVAE
jgi:hypothetical protein